MTDFLLALASLATALMPLITIIAAVAGTGYIIARIVDAKIEGMRETLKANNEGMRKTLEANNEAMRSTLDAQVEAIRTTFDAKIEAIRAIVEEGTRQHDEFREDIRKSNERLDALYRLLLAQKPPAATK